MSHHFCAMPLLVYVFVTTSLFAICVSVKMLGPGDLIFKTFENCEPEKTDFYVWITHRKYNRTTNVLDITLISPWAIDENVILEITSEVKKEGGYKPGGFHLKDAFCEVLKTLLGDLFDSFLKAIGTDSCPMTEGTYEIKDFHLDNAKATVPLLYGEYRTYLEMWRYGEQKGCYCAYLEIVPKYQYQ